MKFLPKLAVIAAIVTSMSACGWLFGDNGTFRNRGDDYRNARIEAPLKFPQGIDSEAIDDSYAIPPISDRTTLDKTFEVPPPEPLSDDLDRDSVRINTLGSTRWILIDGAPGQVWPRLRGFLNLNELTLERVDAVNGIIETAWLQPEGEGLLRERYQLRIEQGVQRATSEVYILQADIRAGQDQWPEKSTSDDREEIMTQELAQYLADSSATAVSMLAQQAIDSSGKVTLEEDDNGNAFIRLNLRFDRAWASAGRALTKAGFKVDDLNREEQIYYVRFIEEEDRDDGGFFSSMFGGNDNKEASDDKGTPYYIKLHKQDAETVTLTIERENDEVMEKRETEKRLKLIKRHIT
jgi:outer membrane protein assembly factor BamC